MNLFNKETHPYCRKGYQYALDVVSGDVVTNIYVKGICKKVLADFNRKDEFYFDATWAEKYLRLFQNFHHVIGEWDTPNIVLEPWQCFMFMTVEGFYWKKNDKRKYKTLHCEVARGNGKALSLDTQVSTPYGFKYLGDIHVGDEVVSRSGDRCFVTNETEIHFPCAYEIILDNGEQIFSSEDHLWFVGESLVLSTKEIYDIVTRGNTVSISDSVIKAIGYIGENTLPMKCIQVDSPDSSFLITESLVATHNSALGSVSGLIYLSLFKTLKGNKVFSAATKKEQARIVLDSSREMAKANPSFLSKTGTEVYAHHLTHEASGSEYKALSSDSKSLDGLQPVLAIVDELHAHKDRAVYDVIDSAMSKRKDSLLMVITTAGFSLEGIGYSQSCYAKKVALGEIPDETFFPFVFTLDEGDDWKDPSVWIKSNPNMGVSVDPDAFESKAFKAKANPSDETNFLVKHLNIWQNAAHQFFNIKSWNLVANHNLKIEDFIGQKCFVGIDIASKKDLTSFVYIFRKYCKERECDLFYLFSENFLPEFAVEESKNVNYKRWVDEGLIIKTPGKAINYEFIEERFVANSKKYKIQEAFFDPWNAMELSQRMSKAGIEMVEFKMNTSNLSEPMKKLDAEIIEKRVMHNGSELFTWCLSNVVAKMDHNENVFPRKEHENMKIDPIISAIMAMAGHINEEAEGSVYEKRGMIFI